MNTNTPTTRLRWSTEALGITDASEAAALILAGFEVLGSQHERRARTWRFAREARNALEQFRRERDHLLAEAERARASFAGYSKDRS